MAPTQQPNQPDTRDDKLDQRASDATPTAERTSSHQRRRKPRSAAGRPRRRKLRRRRGIPLPIFVISAVILVLAVVDVVLAVGKVDPKPDAEDKVEEQVAEPEQTSSVSFCAVGNNLINAESDTTVDLLGLADAWGGTADDGEYDFSPLYAQVKDTISSYDIALISQETTLGGNNGYEYQGYPAYNTPDSLANAVADAGFDVVNCNTNHTYDTWVDSIEHAQEVWAAQDGVTVIGSYASEDDREEIRVLERNGITIAFLSYSDGQNGYDLDDLPNDYYAVPFDKEKMRDEVARAKTLADVVVVYMHWGEENTYELSDEQKEYASYLAGLGVDLAIGGRANTIQPVEYVTRGIRTTDGSGANEKNGMLCVYGLGDFVSGYTLPKAILSGMFTCDFVRDPEGQVTIQNPAWHGLVEHNEDDEDAVYLLSDYTQELAQSNALLARVGEDDTYETSDPLKWAQDTTREVVGDAIAVEV